MSWTAALPKSRAPHRKAQTCPSCPYGQRRRDAQCNACRFLYIYHQNILKTNRSTYYENVACTSPRRSLGYSPNGLRIAHEDERTRKATLCAFVHSQAAFGSISPINNNLRCGLGRRIRSMKSSSLSARCVSFWSRMPGHRRRAPRKRSMLRSAVAIIGSAPTRFGGGQTAL
jgi:hypothetical protein